AKQIPSNPKHLRAAVGHLLQIKMPKWFDVLEKRIAALDAKHDPIEGAALRKKMQAEAADIDPEEFSKLEKKVLLIARYTGMLRTELKGQPVIPDHEPLRAWPGAADRIP